VNSSNFLDYADLPRYSSITPEVIEEGIRTLLQQLEIDVAQVEVHGKADWPSGMEPVALALTKLHSVWGKVNHLLAVKNSPELREVHARVQPLVVQFGLRVSQSRKLLKLFEEVRAGNYFAELDEPRQRFVNEWILAARQAGVELEGEALKLFNENQKQLAQFSVEFSNHVLDDMKVKGVVVSNESDLDGTPAQVRDRCAQRGALLQRESEGVRPDIAAGGAGAKEKIWFVSVDPTVSRPILQHCHNQELRRRIYRECIQIAGHGINSNANVLENIIRLKNSQATLLGYPSTAAMCLESRLAKTPAVAIDFLENLLKDVRPVALSQFDQIREFSKRQGASDVELADIGYWSERLREEKLGFSVEELRPYFPLQKVLEGLIQVIQIVFGVTVREATDGVDVWHPDVRYYLVENIKGEQVASFYFDPFVRPENKRSGAWMGICRYGYALSSGGLSLPIAYIICNQTPLNSEGHSLMNFEEVTTLFHEFGHALHHMLAPPSWIGTSPMELSEWDSIEIESQFMEGWCYQPQVLRLISGHYQTGEVLPDHLVAALRKERSFFRGHQLLRQLHLGLTDLYIFSDRITDLAQAQRVYHEVGARTREMPPLKEDSMLCAFGHIFSGGYTAGYYSYLWSQVLSADLFSAFSAETVSGAQGTEADWVGRIRETGTRFAEKFFTGAGAVDPLKAFEDFMGRKPMNSAFLAENGIVGYNDR